MKENIMRLVSAALLIIMVIFMAEACNEKDPRPTAESRKYKATQRKNHTTMVHKSETVTPAAAQVNPEAEPAPEVVTREREVEVPEYLPSVVSMTICTGIIDREPADNLAVVELSQGKIFTHSAISSQEPDTIFHVYKFEGTEVARVPLRTGKSSRWRTWSSKRLDPMWVGKWTVEIQSGGGTILDAKAFTVMDTKVPAQEAPDTASPVISSTIY